MVGWIIKEIINNLMDGWMNERNNREQKATISLEKENRGWSYTSVFVIYFTLN